MSIDDGAKASQCLSHLELEILVWAIIKSALENVISKHGMSCNRRFALEHPLRRGSKARIAVCVGFKNRIRASLSVWRRYG